VDCGPWFTEEEQALRHVDYFVERFGGCGSLMADYIKYGDCDSMIALLNRKPKWRIVMRIVVTHASRKAIATSGLYGLLGDAPVQIVDTADHEKLDDLYRMAELGESTHDLLAQRSIRESPERPEQELAKIMSTMTSHGRGPVTSEIRPAVIFRACPFNCKLPNSTLPARW
jgi:hypothetical protein